MFRRAQCRRSAKSSLTRSRFKDGEALRPVVDVLPCTALTGPKRWRRVDTALPKTLAAGCFEWRTGSLFQPSRAATSPMITLPVGVACWTSRRLLNVESRDAPGPTSGARPLHHRIAAR